MQTARSTREPFPYPREWETEESSAISRTVARWAHQEMITRRLEFREDYSHQIKALGLLSRELGLDSMVWPVETGGTGLVAPKVATTIVRGYEEIGRADAGLAFVSSMKMALACLLTEGVDGLAVVEEARRAVFSGFYAGELKLVSLILPGLGDVDQPRRPMLCGKEVKAMVRKQNDAWIVQARNARPINSGCDAHIYGVVAGAPDGFVLALVPADAPGVKRSSEPLKATGLLASRNCDVDLNNVNIRDEYVLPMSESAYKRLITWIDLLYGALSVGAAMDAYLILKNWAENRVIKGGLPGHDNPVWAQVLALHVMNVMNSRLLVHTLARAVAHPEVFGGMSVEDCFVMAQSIATKVVTDCWRGIDRGMELMASAGYAREWNIEKHWRDLKTIQAYLGGGVPMQMDVARVYYGAGGCV